MVNCDEKKFNLLIIIDLIILLLISTMHIIFYVFITETDFNNIFDKYNSSPLFNFELNTKCGYKNKLTLHEWSGIKKRVFSKRG